MTDRNTAITLSRITGMIFIVLCHIVEYFWFVPGHEVLGHFLIVEFRFLFLYQDTCMD